MEINLERRETSHGYLKYFDRVKRIFNDLYEVSKWSQIKIYIIYIYINTRVHHVIDT